MAYKTLDKLVREFMSQRGDEVITKQYPRFLQMAIRGVRYMNKKQKNNYKIKRVNSDDLTYNDTVALPEGYIKYRQIAVCINGNLIGLGRNNSLCPPSTDDCGNPLVTAAYSSTAGYDGVFLPIENDPSVIQNRDFGYGGGFNGIGYYRIYENEGYIAISIKEGVTFDELIIEYLADSEQIDGEYYVHPFDEDAILDYIYWQSIQRLRTIPTAEKKEAEFSFKRSMLDAQKMKERFNVRELVSAIRSGFQSGPKI
jgi:hypothetical protein